MSTILWLEKDIAKTARRTKGVYAIVRFFAWGAGFSKDVVDPVTADWKVADLLGLVKADGPNDAWQTFTAQPNVPERFSRFVHSIFVVAPVEDLPQVTGMLQDRIKHAYNVREDKLADHDNHRIRYVIIY